jgi:DNA-binding response OmpR family regulator
MSHVLIVEDEQHLADGLRFNLEAEGYQVSVVDTGEAAIETLTATPDSFDVVVLDVMLPGKDGFEVISEVRHAGQFVPTLMLTARSRPEDVLRGFEAGADDYIAKPFDLSILIARIRGLLRRREWLGASRNPPSAPPASPDVLTFGEKSVDLNRLELRVGEQVFHLIEHAGEPVPRKKLLEDVWGLHEDTDTRAIDNFIVRLRRYIEDDPSRPRHLLTIRGVGYRFVAEPADS